MFAAIEATTAKTVMIKIVPTIEYHSTGCIFVLKIACNMYDIANIIASESAVLKKIYIFV